MADKNSTSPTQGYSSKKEQKARRKQATASVQPVKIKGSKKHAKKSATTIPATIGAGLIFLSVTSKHIDKKFEKANETVKRWQSEMQNNFPDGMCAGDRIRYQMKMQDEQKRIARLEKLKRTYGELNRLIGRSVNAVSTMARTTLMGTSAGVLQADKSDISQTAITTGISTPSKSSSAEMSM